MIDKQIKVIKNNLNFKKGSRLEASIKHYLKTGVPTGIFFDTLKDMLNEYSN